MKHKYSEIKLIDEVYSHITILRGLLNCIMYTGDTEVLLELRDKYNNQTIDFKYGCFLESLGTVEDITRDLLKEMINDNDKSFFDDCDNNLLSDIKNLISSYSDHVKGQED